MNDNFNALRYLIGRIAFDGKTWWWHSVGTHAGQGGYQYGTYSFGSESLEDLFIYVKECLERDTESYLDKIKEHKESTKQ